MVTNVHTYGSRSLTRVKAARRLFLGGSFIPSSAAFLLLSVLGVGKSPELLALIFPERFSSTLAAGVSGGKGSKGLFIGTVGVTMGDMTFGNDVVVNEGVDMGVATAEFVRGKE